MINEDELYEKFSKIEELPITEEMLGAYIEGNITELAEISEIEFMIETQPSVANILDEVYESPINKIVMDQIDSAVLFQDVACPEDYNNTTDQDPFLSGESNFDCSDVNDLQDLLSQLELPSIGINQSNGFYSTDNISGLELNDPTNLNL